MLRNSKGDSEGVASDLGGEPDKDDILEAKWSVFMIYILIEDLFVVLKKAHISGPKSSPGTIV